VPTLRSGSHTGNSERLALRLRMARTMKHETAWDRYQRARAEDGRRRETIARMGRRPFAAQAPQKVALAPPPATEGRGWKVIANPRVPHAALEEHVRKIWAFTWHEIPFPHGWHARWGQMNAKELMSAFSLDRTASAVSAACLAAVYTVRPDSVSPHFLYKVASASSGPWSAPQLT
jgi:hypothetical protein